MKIKKHIVFINVLTITMISVFIWFAVKMLRVGSVSLAVACMFIILYLTLSRVIMIEGD